MTREELQEILEALQRHRTDATHIEAKRAQNELPKRLWETLSSFSNSTGGGVIILGLDEAGGFQVVGVSDLAKVQADLASQCDQMEPVLRPLIQIFDVEGRAILVAEIAELAPEQKPCYYKGAGLTNGAFIRVADGDRTLTPYEVQALLEARRQPRHDVEPLPGTSLADLRPDMMQPLLSRLREREGAPYREWSDERILRALHVLVPGDDGRLVVSLTGWLSFAAYPQELFPNLCVTFVRYPTLRAGEPGPGGERFLDNVRIEGPIPQMIVETLRVAKRNMQRRGIVQGLFREDLWEYPETVLREAIVNAIGHRDLSPQARGAQVQLQMFPDRLEVVSPGGLFGPIQPDQLGQVGVQSSRNEFLMHLLEDLSVPGERRALCENRGTGLASMLEQLRRVGMTLPHFDLSLTRFRLSLPNHTLFDSDTLVWLEQVTKGYSLSESQRQALAYLRHASQLSNADYCRLTGVDSRVATRELSDLVDQAVLRRIGSGRWTTYEITRPAPSRERPSLPARADSTSKVYREEIIELLRAAGPLSAREIAERLGISSRSARLWIRNLRDAKQVVPTADSLKSPNARYSLAGSENIRSR